MTPTVRRSTRLAATLACALLVAACGGDGPDALRAKAQTALAQSDPRAAEIHLKNLLQQKPDDVEARMLLAGVHAANRDPRSAEKEWERALELGASPDRALPGLLEARVMANDAKGALAAAGKWSATAPEAKAAAAYWTGRAHASLGDAAKAEQSFRQALAAQPDLHRARVGIASLQAARNDTAGARATVDEVLAKAPALSEALLLKADLQLAARDFPGARDTLGKAIEADPRGAQARIRLVSLLTDTGELQAAEAAHAELAKVAPNLPMTLFLKATLDARQGRLDAARDGVTAVLKSMPEYLPAVALASSVALRQNSLEQAEAHARTIVGRAPDSVIGARLLAAVLMRKNEPDRALEVAKRLIDRGVADAALLGLAGEAALRRNDLKAAGTYFERSTALAPKDPTQRTGLGLARIAAGRTEAGLADLATASELDPGAVQADLAIISTHLRARRYDQALAAIDRLEKKQPGKALPHNLRGTTLLARGDAAGARAHFEKALQAEPGFFPAVANLAELDLREKRNAEARQRVEAFVKKEPRNVQAGVALAQFVMRTGGSRDDAIGVLKQVRTANPGAAEPVLALSQLYLQANQPREAIPMLQQALAQHADDRRLLDALGTAFLRADERQQAIETFERLVRLDSRNPAMHQRMGELKASLGDHAGALASFRTAAELDPKAPSAQFGMAAMLVQQGKIEDARRIAASLKKELPGNPAGLALEGDLQAHEKRWADAAASYRKAIALQRTAPLVAKQHQALLRAGQAAEAESALREGLKALPEDPALRLYAGEQAVAASNWKAAAEHYEVALKANPNNVLAMNNLAWSLKELKDPRALKVAETAYERAPQSAAVIDTLGSILAERGEARGLELLKQATVLAPKSPQVRLNYATALARSGDKAGAKAVAEELVKAFPDAPQAARARELAALP